MPDTRSLFLFVSCWLLLAVLTLPSGASAAGVPQTPAAVSEPADTFPIIDNPFAVRQAHLVYLAAKEETGMEATISYLSARGGSTGTLSTLRERAGTSIHQLGTAGSDAALDAELENLRGTTRLFREETDRQMKITGGDPQVLRSGIASAVAGNSELTLLMDRYWKIRKSTGLADFDLRMNRARGTLTTLSENGHEITPAQNKLEEIVALRAELAGALQSRNDAGIELAHKKIHAASVEYARMISSTKTRASSDTRVAQTIDECSGVMTRSGMVNARLSQSGVETDRADELVTQGTIRILAAKNQSRASDPEGAKASLRNLKGTLLSLRDTYRTILAREDLPVETAQDVLSAAQSLGTTAARIGELDL
jgi:hypothetical protein